MFLNSRGVVVTFMIIEKLVADPAEFFDDLPLLLKWPLRRSIFDYQGVLIRRKVADTFTYLEIGRRLEARPEIIIHTSPDSFRPPDVKGNEDSGFVFAQYDVNIIR